MTTPAELFLAAAEPLELTAAGDGPPRFTMVAYTGAAMRFPNQPHPVVVDLQGVSAAGTPLPILRDHDTAQRVGHGELEVDLTARRLVVSGVVSGAGDAAREVRQEAAAGMPWQASIGARIVAREFVPRGSSAVVNGRRFAGPVIVARRSTVFEVSWVVLGADPSTSSRIAATSAIATKGQPMTLDEYIADLGIDPATITAERRTELDTAFKIAQGELRASAADDDADRADEVRTETGDAIRASRKRFAEETRRVEAIRDACGDDNPTIFARAVEEGWTLDRTKLEVLQVGRPQLDSTVRGDRSSIRATTKPVEVLTAATLMSLGFTDDAVFAKMDERSVNLADEKYRGIGFRDLALLCAQNDTPNAPGVFRNGDEVIRAATGPSTSSLASVVSNVAGKVALMTYEAHEIVGRRIARSRPVPDFKVQERFRLVGSGAWQRVGDDGTLKAGLLDDDAYQAQAKTHGQLIKISRDKIVNDDLGILADVGEQMGHSGADLIDRLVFTLILNNTGTFFGAGNSNNLTGAGSALSLDALDDARTLFRKAKAGPGTKAKDKRAINVPPRFILVPPELETLADVLYTATETNLAGSTDAEKANANPFKGKFEPIAHQYLSDTDFNSNASADTWYLAADPSRVHPIELSFLNGVETPTIRQVDGGAGFLGLCYEGFFDVGASFADPRGMVRAVGS